MYTYYGNTLIGQETVEGKKGQGKETIKSLTPNGNKMDLKNTEDISRLLIHISI